MRRCRDERTVYRCGIKEILPDRIREKQILVAGEPFYNVIPLALEVLLLNRLRDQMCLAFVLGPHLRGGWQVRLVREEKSPVLEIGNQAIFLPAPSLPR